MQPGLEEIRSSALWQLYDFSTAEEFFDLRRITENDYRKASFLDQRIEAVCPEAYRYEFRHFSELFTQAQDNPQAHFIFHIGHCGSTLLSRALAADNSVLPIREPLSLRKLADDIKERPQNLQTVLRSLNRHFRADQSSIVKATSTCNRLVHPILSAQTLSRAVLMYVPLESYLAGMLGKQRQPRDLLGHLPSRMRDWASIGGAAHLDQASVSESPARLAVLGWLSSQHLLLDAAEAYPERCLLLDFETFLANPPDELERVSQFLGLDSLLDRILTAWPAVSAGYSKLPEHPYTAANRQQTLQNGRLNRSADIRDGLDFAEQLVGEVPGLQPCRNFF